LSTRTLLSRGAKAPADGTRFLRIVPIRRAADRNAFFHYIIFKSKSASFLRNYSFENSRFLRFRVAFCRIRSKKARTDGKKRRFAAARLFFEIPKKIKKTS
jgi:hypothetical protein